MREAGAVKGGGGMREAGAGEQGGGAVSCRADLRRCLQSFPRAAQRSAWWYLFGRPAACPVLRAAPHAHSDPRPHIRGLGALPGPPRLPASPSATSSVIFAHLHTCVLRSALESCAHSRERTNGRRGISCSFTPAESGRQG